jgi:dipeptidyl aminopeptidase/acylaminoacyl peptidase
VRLRPAACAALLVVVGCTGAGAPTPPDPGKQAQTAVAAIGSGASATPTPVRPLPGQPAPILGTPVPAAASAPGAAGTLAASQFDGRLAVARDDGIAIVEGGSLRQVFKAEPGGSVKDPTFSPDGKSVAFAYAPPRPRVQPGRPIVEQLLHSDIMVVEADGSNPRAVAAHDGPGAILETPAWSHDGKSIYFSYYAPTYRGDELVDEKLEVRRKEIGASAPATTVVKNGSNPELSRDGKWLVYVGEDVNEGQSLRVMAAGGGDDRTLVRADRFASVLAPRFAPDGVTIAFSAADASLLPGAPTPPPAAQPKALAPLDALRDLLGPASAEAHGLPWEIWTIPVSGGAPKQLTKIAEDTPYAAWSSNGSRLLVYGAGGLYMVDAGSGQAKTLSSDGAHGGMDWRSAS